MPISGPYILQTNVTNETINSVTYTGDMAPDKMFRMVQSADGFNAAVIKNSTGGLAHVSCSNVNSSPRYLRFYNTATSPAVGTTTPFRTDYLAGQSEFSVNFSGTPLVFSVGISIAFTASPEDNSTDPIGSGDIMGLNVSYY